MIEIFLCFNKSSLATKSVIFWSKTSGYREEYIQLAWRNEITKLGNFNNWSGGAEVSVVPVVPSYFPFILWMSFSPQHLPRALNQLKDFHVPAAEQSWIISLLVLPLLTFGQEEEIKCTPVTSNTVLGTKGEERKFPWGSWILFPGSVLR